MATTSDHLTALFQVICRLEEGWLAPPWDDGPDFYGYQPLPLAEFLAGLDVCSEHLRQHGVWPTEGYRFCDVGCGIGTKMLLARHLGYDVAGVEADCGRAEIARQLVVGASVVEQDAFELTDLRAFDVVYSYRLCVDLDRQHQLETHLISCMRPGALLYVAGSSVAGLHHVDDQVWMVDGHSSC